MDCVVTAEKHKRDVVGRIPTDRERSTGLSPPIHPLYRCSCFKDGGFPAIPLRFICIFPQLPPYKRRGRAAAEIQRDR